MVSGALFGEHEVRNTRIKLRKKSGFIEYLLGCFVNVQRFGQNQTSKIKKAPPHKGKSFSIFSHEFLQTQQNFLRIPAIGEQSLRILNQLFYFHQEAHGIFPVDDAVIVR